MRASIKAILAFLFIIKKLYSIVNAAARFPSSLPSPYSITTWAGAFPSTLLRLPPSAPVPAAKVSLAKSLVLHFGFDELLCIPFHALPVAPKRAFHLLRKSRVSLTQYNNKSLILHCWVSYELRCFPPPRPKVGEDAFSLQNSKTCGDSATALADLLAEYSRGETKGTVDFSCTLGGIVKTAEEIPLNSEIPSDCTVTRLASSEKWTQPFPA